MEGNTNNALKQEHNGIPESVMKAFVQDMMTGIVQFYEDTENRRRFEEWERTPKH